MTIGLINLIIGLVLSKTHGELIDEKGLFGMLWLALVFIGGVFLMLVGYVEFVLEGNSKLAIKLFLEHKDKKCFFCRKTLKREDDWSFYLDSLVCRKCFKRLRQGTTSVLKDWSKLN